MIIGLTGKLESGKDTVADWLVVNHGFQKVGFADGLYAGVCALFGISLDDAFEWKDNQYGVRVEITDSSQADHVVLTWREFLQRFGTDMARKVWGEDFWVERFHDKYLAQEKYMPDNTNLIIKDVRFNNEAKLIEQFEGTIWNVVRPGKDGDGHESESGIHEGFIAGDLYNDSSIEEFHEMLNWWWTEMFNG